MNLKEDINKVQKKVENLEQESFAMILLKDYKKQTKRLFIIWFVTFVSFLVLLGYTWYLINDIGSNEEIIEIEDVETIDNSHIKIGDDIWEKSE